jgi:hypothetical protein
MPSGSVTPTAPRPGAVNASSRVVCVLATSRAAKISSLSSTRVPRPAASRDAATRTALYRLAGPSGATIVGFRIAPVTTTVWQPPTVRSRKYAVSSSVSVPCVTTTPCSSGRAWKRPLMRRASPTHWAVVTLPDATLLNCSTDTRATESSPGRPDTSCSPVRRAESPRLEIVPPVAITCTTGCGACASATRARGAEASAPSASANRA